MDVYGYIRVSSVDQNEDRQLIALRGKGVAMRHIYLDKQSGKDFHRPQYKRLVKALKPGDLLYVLSIDRLGRDYREIQQQWRLLTKEKRGGHLRAGHAAAGHQAGKRPHGHIYSRSGAADPVLCGPIRAGKHPPPTAGGHRGGQGPGVKFGRPPLPLPENFYEVHRRWRNKELTLRQAAEACGMPTGTFYGKAVKFEKGL